MKRRWNWPIWVGFVFTVAGLFSYEFFARFPITRDFPWANFLLFGIGAAFLIVGLFRAFGRPQVYRGKILGLIFGAIAVLAVAFFSYASSTPCGRCRPRLAPRALDKERLTFYSWIKMENLSASAICFPTQGGPY
jgi:hypothetical protein